VLIGLATVLSEDKREGPGKSMKGGLTAELSEDHCERKEFSRDRVLLREKV